MLFRSARIRNWAEAATDESDALYGVQVAYALPDAPDRLIVYGSRARSVRQQVSAEHGVLYREDIVVDVRIRVYQPGDDAEDAERTAEQIAQRVSAAVSAEPRLVRGTVGVTATDADPTVTVPDPDPSVVVNLLLSVTLSMTSGGA